MKKYLMYAPASPFLNPSPKDCILNDFISTNVGNLIFSYSVSRTVMIEQTEIDYRKVNVVPSESEIEQINQTYDAFLIPLANAFRISFRSHLDVLTKVIRSLKIPCIVIGIGFQGPASGKLKSSYSFDPSVRDFVYAVLEKSSMIGIRGDITARYLRQLGFQEEKDFTVIGCPSMYLYGDHLPEIKTLSLTKTTRININSKITLPQKVHNYLHQVCLDLPDHYYIIQNLYEYLSMYTNMPIKLASVMAGGGVRIKTIPDYYPAGSSSELYQQNRVRAFTSAQALFQFLGQGDLTFGTRIHGNIAGILSGTPSYVIAPDSRVLELAEYHHIPHTTIEKLNPNTDIFHLLEPVDFNDIHTGHKERFEHYLTFLNSNGIDTIYNHEMTAIPFDEKINQIQFHKPIVPYRYETPKEKWNARTLLIEFPVWKILRRYFIRR